MGEDSLESLAVGAMTAAPRASLCVRDGFLANRSGFRALFDSSERPSVKTTTTPPPDPTTTPGFFIFVDVAPEGVGIVVDIVIVLEGGALILAPPEGSRALSDKEPARDLCLGCCLCNSVSGLPCNGAIPRSL